jgi:demethylmenaquinone methyltransferase/2-methoxy-6-polyprenyl-1,4-benzoquinol methylase
MQIKTDDKQKLVKNVFDPIAKKYDLLNHLLSFGVDIYWRKRALKMTNFPENTRLLDVACGTGDFSIEARKKGINNIFGLDLSHEMIKEFHKKAEWSRGNVAQGVAEHLPFKDNSFSNITVGFGVRNFFDIPAGLTEFKRILKPGGQVTILELKLPKHKLFSILYNFYFNKILPVIGRIISDNDVSYTYLPDSVAIFDKQVKMKDILQMVGYKNIKIKKLTFGIVQCINAEK